MTKKKRGLLQTKWVAIPIVLVILLVLFILFKSNLQPKPSITDVYREYQNSQYDFSIAYPKSWEVRNDTQIFEYGDAVTFQKIGPSQKPETEFYDGGRVTIAKPFKVDMNLSKWIKSHHKDQSQFSQQSLGNTVFERVVDCSVGCSTFYYAMVGNDVFGIATFAEGADKMVYENAIDQMLKSLQFKRLER